MEQLAQLRELMVEEGFTPPDLIPNDYTQSAMAINRYFSLTVVPTLNKGYPPGNWYFITVTTKAGSSKADLLELHDSFMAYMQKKAIVQHAVVEKSNIWHVHYFVNLTGEYAKNLQRDLYRHLGVVVDVQPKVSTLKRFNGACKYILKREYAVKGSTHDSTLIDGIFYTPKKGYRLKSSGCAATTTNAAPSP